MKSTFLFYVSSVSTFAVLWSMQLGICERDAFSWGLAVFSFCLMSATGLFHAAYVSGSRKPAPRN